MTFSLLTSHTGGEEESILNGRLFLLGINLTIDEEGWPNRACHLLEVILMVLKAYLSQVVDEALHGRA
jgi:hypothetical protein